MTLNTKLNITLNLLLDFGFTPNNKKSFEWLLNAEENKSYYETDFCFHLTLRHKNNDTKHVSDNVFVHIHVDFTFQKFDCILNNILFVINNDKQVKDEQVFIELSENKEYLIKYVKEYID
jgi:hypothetical protein